MEQVPEQLPQVAETERQQLGQHVIVSPVVGLLLKAEGPAVVEVRGELAGGPLAQHVDGGGHLLLRDSLIFLLLCSSTQALPRQGALKHSS